MSEPEADCQPALTRAAALCPDPQHPDMHAAHCFEGVPSTALLSERTSVLDYLSHRAHTHPTEPCVTAARLDGVLATLSYGELQAGAERVAGWVQDELGAAPGDVFAFMPQTDLPSIVALLGIMRAGCAVLVQSPGQPVNRWRSQVQALSASELLTAVPAVAERHAGAVLIPPLPQLPRREKLRGLELPGPFTPALFFGTSGSTAASKLVAQSHYNGVINALALCRHHQLVQGDRILGCLPIHHVNGLHFTLFATIVAGAHATLLSNFNPVEYRDALEHFRPRLASVVPSILEVLLCARSPRSLPSELECFVSAAAPLAARTSRAIFDRLGVRILQGYGLTETTNFSTTLPARLPIDTYRRLMLDTDIPSIGVALHGNEVAVLQRDGTAAEPGQVGELCVRGHNVMLGYAGNPGANAEAFRGGWFHSRDLGYEIVDGPHRCFVITGRTKNIAKVLGTAVSLDEIERVLMALPDVRDAVCFTVPSQLAGEEIVAGVVSSERVSQPRLEAYLREHLPAEALPSRYLSIDAVPRTPTGKVMRSRLAEELLA